MESTYLVDEFLSYTIGILVLFVGIYLNKKVKLLRNYNIPEAVSGGLVAGLILFFIFLLFELKISYQLETRDRLLVYFFTAIGLNARFSDLIVGGKSLTKLLALTIIFMATQNIVGMSSASLLGLDSKIGVLVGSASLVGGHGTAIAWAPDIAKLGIENAMEIGVAAATLGLVIASLLGGPTANFLINRFKLSSDDKTDKQPTVGIPHSKEAREEINYLNIMAVMLTLHICIIVGFVANESLLAMGFKLPLFLTCLITAIVFSNTLPYIFKKMKWPARTPALALVSDFSLNLFLAMSLMSMQLWTIADLAGPLLVILLCQALAAVLFIVFLVFPIMKKNYQAAVLSSGFAGFALGATPTAIANMTAVTKAYGPAPMAFLILPLVSAFFVDIANSLIIRFALNF